MEIEYQGRKVERPVWVIPGHADDSVTVHLGYGRTQRRAGRRTEIGFNAYAVRTSDAPWVGAGVQLRKTGDEVTISPQRKQTETMEGREPVKIMTYAEYLARSAGGGRGSSRET